MCAALTGRTLESNLLLISQANERTNVTRKNGGRKRVGERVEKGEKIIKFLSTALNENITLKRNVSVQNYFRYSSHIPTARSSHR